MLENFKKDLADKHPVVFGHVHSLPDGLDR